MIGQKICLNYYPKTYPNTEPYPLQLGFRVCSIGFKVTPNSKSHDFFMVAFLHCCSLHLAPLCHCFVHHITYCCLLGSSLNVKMTMEENLVQHREWEFIVAMCVQNAQHW